MPGVTGWLRLVGGTAALAFGLWNLGSLASVWTSASLPDQLAGMPKVDNPLIQEALDDVQDENGLAGDVYNYQYGLYGDPTSSHWAVAALGVSPTAEKDLVEEMASGTLDTELGSQGFTTGAIRDVDVAQGVMRCASTSAPGLGSLEVCMYAHEFEIALVMLLGGAPGEAEQAVQELI